MEIREFAERILLATTLEEKLFFPEIVSDHSPHGAYFSVRVPERPEGLRLDRWNSEAKVPFPSVDKLHDNTTRGKVFHFFANHELLALELMALALLKFPDAPPAFRSGLMRTINEEQKHMALYKEHMGRMGVEFGEIPVNDFFWTCLSPMRSPLEFVTQMSLTFEQANLDYSLYYADAFRKVGDVLGAEILDLVYREEIGHVKHGFVWFERLRDHSLSDWDAYVSNLRFPLTPARAKGNKFSVEVRREIGFSERFIEELQVFSHTKGRPPVAYFFNPACEYEASDTKFAPSSLVQSLEEDFQHLPMFLANAEDVVLSTKRPNKAFLIQLKNFGFGVPEFLEFRPSDNGLQSQVSGRSFAGFAPWGWSPRAEKIGEHFRGSQFDAEKFSEFYSKSYAAKLALEFGSSESNSLCPLVYLPNVAYSLSEVEEALSESSAIEKWVLKTPYSSSGRDRIFLDTSKSFPESATNWVKKQIANFGTVIVEPWVERVADLSLQMKVDGRGKISIAGMTRFVNTHRGQFLATVVGEPFFGLPKEAVRFLYGNGRTECSALAQLERCGQWVANIFSQRGYNGPIAIDSMLFRTNEQELAFRPLLEINPRFTMGRIAKELSLHVTPGKLALWVHLRKETIAPLNSFEEFAQHCALKWPIVFQGRILAGVLLTSDPAHTKNFSTALIVGEQTVEEFLSEFEFLDLKSALNLA